MSKKKMTYVIGDAKPLNVPAETKVNIPDGLNKWLPDEKSSGTFLGVDRTTEPFRFSSDYSPPEPESEYNEDFPDYNVVRPEIQQIDFIIAPNFLGGLTNTLTKGKYKLSHNDHFVEIIESDSISYLVPIHNVKSIKLLSVK